MIRTKLLGLLALLVFCFPASILAGGQKGNGGDGLSGIFTEMGTLIYRHALKQQPTAGLKTLKELLPMNEFASALAQTRVVTTNRKLFDTRGFEVTALYYDPDVLAKYWNRIGFSQDDVKSRLSDEMAKGVIEVNRDRFLQELVVSFDLAFKTVFHEYARAVGVHEINYQFSQSLELAYFFEGVYADAPVFNRLKLQVLNLASAHPTGGWPQLTVSEKIAVVEREQAKVSNIIGAHKRELAEAINRRELQREAIRQSRSNSGFALAHLDIMSTVVDYVYAQQILRGTLGISDAAGGSLDDIVDRQILLIDAKIRELGNFHSELERRRQSMMVESLK